MVLFIIFGTRSFTGTEEEGEFYCPSCRRKEEYDLKAVRSWFVLYFVIPVFPVSGIERYVECLGCKQAFHEDVLDMPPPRGTHVNDLYDRFE